MLFIASRRRQGRSGAEREIRAAPGRYRECRLGEATHILYLPSESGSTSSSHFLSRTAFCPSEESSGAWRLFSRTDSST